MKKKSVGNGIYIDKKWEFNSNVAEHFDVHIEKSIPLYSERHNLILDILETLMEKKTKKWIITDIGCSTGILTEKISKKFHDKNILFYNIDSEPSMIEIAKQRKYSSNHKIFWYNKSIESFPLPRSDIVICYYVMHFIPKKKRQIIIHQTYTNLNKNGIFIFFEKIQYKDPITTKWHNQLLFRFKKRKGFTDEEIINKEKSLKGILIPNTTEENFSLLKKAGFKNYSIILRYLNFEGILAIK